ncbi:MAG: hypothetical protein WC768_00240 [Patescibacteria group bacterium]|jgi:ribosomal protein L35
MKLKTHQATAKKIKITNGKKGQGGKKYFTRHAGQDHFNARETGNTTRHKRKDTQVNHVDLKTIKKALPYS